MVFNRARSSQEQEADTWRRKAERQDQETNVFQRKATEAAEQADTWRNRFAELEHRYGGLLARLETTENERQTEVKFLKHFCEALAQFAGNTIIWQISGNVLILLIRYNFHQVKTDACNVRK